MGETVNQTDYEREVWRRTQLEEMIGDVACRRFGLSVFEYVRDTNVQLELDYD